MPSSFPITPFPITFIKTSPSLTQCTFTTIPSGTQGRGIHTQRQGETQLHAHIHQTPRCRQQTDTATRSSTRTDFTPSAMQRHLTPGTLQEREISPIQSHGSVYKLTLIRFWFGLRELIRFWFGLRELICFWFSLRELIHFWFSLQELILLILLIWSTRTDLLLIWYMRKNWFTSNSVYENWPAFDSVWPKLPTSTSKLTHFKIPKDKDITMTLIYSTPIINSSHQ